MRAQQRCDFKTHRLWLIQAERQKYTEGCWPRQECGNVAPGILSLCHQMRPPKPPGAGLGCRVCVYVLCVGGVPPNKLAQKSCPQGLCRNVHQEVPRSETDQQHKAETTLLAEGQRPSAAGGGGGGWGAARRAVEFRDSAPKNGMALLSGQWPNA